MGGLVKGLGAIQEGFLRLFTGRFEEPHSIFQISEKGKLAYKNDLLGN
jgi:hypothetical protein